MLNNFRDFCRCFVADECLLGVIAGGSHCLSRVIVKRLSRMLCLGVSNNVCQMVATDIISRDCC